MVEEERRWLWGLGPPRVEASRLDSRLRALAAVAFRRVAFLLLFVFYKYTFVGSKRCAEEPLAPSRALNVASTLHTPIAEQAGPSAGHLSPPRCC